LIFQTIITYKNTKKLWFILKVIFKNIKTIKVKANGSNRRFRPTPDGPLSASNDLQKKVSTHNSKEVLVIEYDLDVGMSFLTMDHCIYIDHCMGAAGRDHLPFYWS